MARKQSTVEFRRKRKKKTDYKLRMELLKSQKPRLVVRKHLNNLDAQIILYEPKGDKVVISAKTSALKKLGWKYHCGNTPSSYLLGYLIGKKAVGKKITEAIMDLGEQTSIKGSVIYAVVKGAVDAGLKIPHNPEILPGENRITGKQIADYARKLSKENPEQHQKQFSSYFKQNTKPEDITKNFEETKKKIGT